MENSNPTFLNPIQPITYQELTQVGNKLYTNNLGLAVMVQNLSSPNFRVGAAGWILRSNGDAEFNQRVRLPNLTTTERDAMIDPLAGTIIYNTTTAKLNVYTTAWEAVTSV